MSHLRSIMGFSTLPGSGWWPSPGIFWFFDVTCSLIWMHGITLTICLWDPTTANLGAVQYLITTVLAKVYLNVPCQKSQNLSEGRFLGLLFLEQHFCFRIMSEHVVLKAFQC